MRSPILVLSLSILLLAAAPMTTTAAPSEGYTLVAPMNSTTTTLIDLGGNEVHSWPSPYTPGLSAYLNEDGSILRSGRLGNPDFSGGGSGGAILLVDWDGNTVWDYTWSDSTHCQHHDVEMLPNGHVLIVAWEMKTQQQAIDAGRDPSLIAQGELWPDTIIEVEPDGLNSGTVVWEWHVWDHLVQDFDPTKDNYGVVADHPELADINFVPNGTQADWNHLNAVAYNARFDQIIISVHNFHELWVIDHSTTTAQAAGHSGGNSGMGGDILYRWGNPQAYGAGTATDQKFFGQHDAQWIAEGCLGEGHMMVFNNGRNRPEGNYSTVDEIVPPVDAFGNYSLVPGTAYEPTAQTWIYTATPPTECWSGGISGAQRLPNGNTLVVDGDSNRIFEVTPAMATEWEYTATGHIFKARRYAPDYPGLARLFTVDATLTCNPGAGTLPFQSLFAVSLENLYDGQTRQLAGRIDMGLANGTSVSNWRSGYTNVGPGASFSTSWNQSFPALGALVGESSFTLAAEDVTPAPYNQPPYPAAGDTATDSCTITCYAP